MSKVSAGIIAHSSPFRKPKPWLLQYSAKTPIIFRNYYFPGGITIAREYDRLVCLKQTERLEETVLPCPGELLLSGLRIICLPVTERINTPDAFTVCPVGQIRIRARKSGDHIRLSGGSKSLKKLFIDRKIPAARRQQIPVVCDDQGILGIFSIGANLDRISGENPVLIRFENTEDKGESIWIWKKTFGKCC